MPLGGTLLLTLGLGPVGSASDSISSAGLAISADSAWVETAYTYEPVSLQPRVVTISASDGAARRTETVYAHEIYSGMGRAGRHQLTAVYESAVRQSAGAATLSCGRTEFRQLQGSAWVPDRSYEGCGSEQSQKAHFLTYDALGRPRQIDSPAGAKGIITYTGRHVTAIRQEHTRWSSGQPVVVALQQTFAYDNLGRLQRITDENSIANFYLYDGLGRLREVRQNSLTGAIVSDHQYYYSGSAFTGGGYNPGQPNYVRTRLYSGYTYAPTQTHTGYLDGLGRQLQSHVWSAGWSVISMGEYDDLGRPYRAWRPVMMSNSAQTYILPASIKTWATSNPTSSQGQEYGRYGNAPGNGTGTQNRPFSETNYEASPLSRVTTTRAPGRSPSTSSSSPYAGSGALVVQIYGVNAPSWQGQAKAQPMAYSETRDEEGRWTRTYSDGLGRARFISQGRNQSQETLTETLYDASDRVLEVRPPHYFAPPPNSVANDWRTLYSYDSRGLLLEKTTVDTRHWSGNGPGRFRYRYDDHGRLRYSQDPGQRGTGQVAFLVYDPLGRVEYEGVGRPDICKTSSTRETCWTQLDPHIGTRIPDASAPTCTYPDGSPCHWEWMSGNWRAMNLYDDAVQQDGTGSRRVEAWPFHGDPTFSYLNLRGRRVATAYRTDGLWASDGGAWETTLFAYDRDGNVLRRWVRHSNAAPQWAKYTYTFSRQGQLMIDGVELGARNLTHDYRYNARGYMASVKAFNNGTGLGTTRDVTFSNAADGSLFRMQFRGSTSGSRDVHYRHDVAGRIVETNNPDATASPGSGPPFAQRLVYTPGGLIGRQDWLTPYSVQYCPSGYPTTACTVRSHFEYAYDGLARLITANHVPQGTSPSTTVGYDLRNVTYDRQGNILTLHRRAPATNGAWQLMDQLSYSYDNRMNRLNSVNDGVWSADSRTSWFAYDRNGNMTWQERYYEDSGGVVEEYYQVNRLDERNLPERISHYVFPGTSLNHDYAYDAAGQRIRKVQRSIGSGGSSDPHYQVERHLREGLRTIGVFDGEGNLKWWNLGGAAGSLGRIEAEEVYSLTMSGDPIMLTMGTLATEEEATSSGDPSTGAVYRGPRERTLTGVLEEELHVIGVESDDARVLARTMAPRLAQELIRVGRRAASDHARTRAQARGGRANLGGDIYTLGLPEVVQSLERSLRSSGHPPLADSLVQRVASAIAAFAAGEAANEVGRTRAAQALARVGLQLPPPVPADTLDAEDGFPDELVTDPFAVPESEDEEIMLMTTSSSSVEYHWRYYISDHLGSIRAVLDANGTVIEARDYYPYGLMMPGRVFVQGQETREGYTGHELDSETGMYYAGARYYMPALGRWTAVDPLAESFSAWSPYNYVMGRPVGMVDPDGMAPCDPPQACDFSGWNAFRPMATALERAYTQVADRITDIGEAISSVATRENARTALTVVSVAAGVTALALTGCGALAGCATAAGGTAALSGAIATSGTVAAYAGLGETAVATVQAVRGETTVLDATVTGVTSIGIAHVGKIYTASRLSSTSSSVLAPTGIDSALDASLAASRRNMNNVASGVGAGSGALLGAGANATLSRAVQSSECQVPMRCE